MYYAYICNTFAASDESEYRTDAIGRYQTKHAAIAACNEYQNSHKPSIYWFTYVDYVEEEGKLNQGKPKK